jgi:hypothetical protein
MAKTQTLLNAIREAVVIYRNLSKKGIAIGDDTVHINDLRAAFSAANIMCVDRDGTDSKDGSISLKLHKEIARMADSGIKAGKWDSKDDFKAWKKARFLSIKTNVEYEDFGDMFDDLD